MEIEKTKGCADYEYKWRVFDYWYQIDVEFLRNGAKVGWDIGRFYGGFKLVRQKEAYDDFFKSSLEGLMSGKGPLNDDKDVKKVIDENMCYFEGPYGFTLTGHILNNEPKEWRIKEEGSEDIWILVRVERTPKTDLKWKDLDEFKAEDVWEFLKERIERPDFFK